MVDGCRNKLANVVSGVPQSRTGAIIVPHLRLGAFPILENKLIGFADDSTLMAVVPSPGVRSTVAESLIRGLGSISDW